MFEHLFSKKLLVILVAIAMVSLTSEGFAQPRRRNAVTAHRVPRHGRFFVRPPVRHKPVWVRGVRYRYHRGVFYRKRPFGYIVVRAPVGAVVAAIPIGFVTFVVGTDSYYYYGGVYYQRVPSGYVVVEPPPVAVSVDETPSTIVGESVSVTAPLLNVRSGPGKKHPVIHQVHQGDILLVQGHAPGWFYVKLPSGEFGWVMSEFVDQLLPDASG